MAKCLAPHGAEARGGYREIEGGRRPEGKERNGKMEEIRQIGRDKVSWP